MKKVVVRVPASTANLGPGFDTLGLALSLYNTLELEEAEHGITLTVEGEGSETLTRDGTKNLASRAALAAFEQIGYHPKGLRLRLKNQIPLKRGLGSSGTAILGGIVAAAKLAGTNLPPEAILKLAVSFEGHPDNVTPSLLGGFTASALVEGQVLYVQLPFPEGIKAVAVIPAVEIPTREARRILPNEVPLRDAVFNLSRQALMLAGFVTGRLDLLAEGAKDRLHQPYRAKLLPGMLEVMEEGLKRGALACFLSGAGSTIIALAKGEGEEIGEKMRELWRSRFGIVASSLVLEVDRQGLISFD
ncbi:MAG: homoserine kinase [candidate division NC10 bacterium]|nr:homoserine kinase [candidate division NC10 bacterium]